MIACLSTDMGAEVDLGHEQLRMGLAWALTRYADELPEDRRAAYVAAAARARSGRVGLWSSESTPIPPSEWRGSSRRLPGD
jgi:endonuclease YncB( thermonuclease family)